jgi:thiamine-monophosphate kinase
MKKLQPTSMIDVSDGLISDLWHILEMSKAGVSLKAEAIPVSEGVLDWHGGDRGAALAMAIKGGEDYELLLTVNEQSAEALDEVAAETGLDLTAIGKIASKKKGFVLATDGVEAEIERGGFDHFKSPADESKEV